MEKELEEELQETRWEQQYIVRHSHVMVDHKALEVCIGALSSDLG